MLMKMTPHHERARRHRLHACTVALGTSGIVVGLIYSHFAMHNHSIETHVRLCPSVIKCKNTF